MHLKKRFLFMSLAAALFFGHAALAQETPTPPTACTPADPASGGYTISLPFTSGNGHYCNFTDYFIALMKWSINIAELLAVLMVIWGAFKYTTSGGDQSKAKEGKDIIVGALVGFALLLLIRVLIPIIGV